MTELKTFVLKVPLLLLAYCYNNIHTKMLVSADLYVVGCSDHMAHKACHMAHKACGWNSLVCWVRSCRVVRLFCANESDILN
jgi:hypothetical protein